MPSVELDIKSDLTYLEDGALTIQTSKSSGNIFQILDDGIYAMGTYDWNIRDGQKTPGITVGIISEFYPVANSATGQIAVTGLVHRSFVSTGEKVGEKLVGLNGADLFRSPVDYCLPGDVFRVKVSDTEYDYYLIIKTDPLKNDENGYSPGNVITDYAKLGRWGEFHQTGGGT